MVKCFSEEQVGKTWEHEEDEEAKLRTVLFRVLNWSRFRIAVAHLGRSCQLIIGVGKL